MTNPRIIKSTSILRVEVIATFDFNVRVLRKIRHAAQITNTSQNHVGGSQVLFKLDIPIYPTTSYEAVMRRVKREAVRLAFLNFQLAESEIVFLSTEANWQLWEQLTGKNRVQCDAVSKVCRNGKI